MFGSRCGPHIFTKFAAFARIIKKATPSSVRGCGHLFFVSCLINPSDYTRVGWLTRRPHEDELYDIATEILCKTCFGHNSTQNAPKSMIPVRVCTDFCVDAESAIKTRFYALFKN